MKKSTCQYRKVILVAKFTCTNQYKIFSKEMDYKGIHSYFIGFFNQPEKNLLTEECYSNECDCYSIHKHIILEAGPKVGCFAGFCHHHLMTMSLRIAFLCLKVV